MIWAPNLGSYPPLSLEVENRHLKVIETMKQLIQVKFAIPRRQQVHILSTI